MPSKIAHKNTWAGLATSCSPFMAGVRPKMILPVKQRLQVVLTTWPFILCLSLLIANDWWLKYSFSGVISGKLSDFSGLAVVTLLLFASLPQKKLLVYVVIVSSFIWWKSPLSTPFIDFVNNLTSIRFGRVVDYIDCWALVTLPACNYIATYPNYFIIPSARYKKAIQIPVFTIAIFAIMGTTIIPAHQNYTVRTTTPATTIQQQAMLATIAEVSKKHGLSCSDCEESYGGTFSGKGITMAYSFTDPNTVSFIVTAYPNALFFGTSGKGKADSLRASLKEALAEKFSGLEYIETLKDNSY